MNWNDYEAIWKRQPLPKGADADLGELRETFEGKSRKLAATLQVRDFLEAGAGVVVAVAYGFYWALVGAKGWPMGVAILLMLGVTAFFLRERWRSRRSRPAADATVLQKIEADLAELQHQARLLRTVWAWYLLPCELAMGIHFAVIKSRMPDWSALHDPWFIAAAVLFSLVMLGVVWAANFLALRKQVQPRIAELEKLRADMTLLA